MLQVLLPVVPMLLVVLTACALLFAGRVPGDRRGADAATTVAVPVIGLLAALIASVLLWRRGPDAVGLIEADTYASFFNVAFSTLGLFTVVMSTATRRPDGGGHHALLLLALAGMMGAAAARDLIVAVLAIEVAWVASLLLAGAGRHREPATETAFKAIILGAFSGALWLYGVALVYAMTGATRLDVLAARIAASSLDPGVLMLVAITLVLGGLAFVVAAAPFHFWTADVCSGADEGTAGLITTGLRLAGFAVFLRVLLTAFEPLRIDWLPVLSAMAGLTMIAGAVTAVGQSNVRRLLADIGVAYSGYLLVGLITASQAGKASVLFSLVTWGAANAGVFAVLATLTAGGQRRHDLRDFTGFGYERPGVAALLAVCLISLGGLPPTAGFAAKWLVIGAALQEGLVSLAVLSALSSVVLAFVCLRLVVQMYMVTAHGPRRRSPVPPRAVAALAVLVAVLVGAGAWPGPLLAAAMASVAAVF